MNIDAEQLVDDIAENWDKNPDWRAEAIPTVLAAAVLELAEAVRDAGNTIAEAIRVTS